MAEYKGKKIYNGSITVGNPYRRDYRDSVNAFLDKKIKEGVSQRDEFMRDIVEDQQRYRQQFVDMIGTPVSPYPDTVPASKSEYIGSDDFCDITYMQIETMPDFWFYGIFMMPHGVKKAPLVIAQHGGGSVPEICSELLGNSNYSFFTKRALERGMAVFVPQLLLWKFDIETGEKKVDIDVCYDRSKIDSKLKQIGLSITGLEVFCLRRSIDYFCSLDCIDGERIGMMGLSYGGYFSLHTAAADTRIKSIYAAGFFNDRSKIGFEGWKYKNNLNTFCDAEVAALCAPRRLWLDVGKTDPVFDYAPSVDEGARAAGYYARFNASDKFRYNLWEGGHSFDSSERGFEFFFDGI